VSGTNITSWVLTGLVTIGLGVPWLRERARNNELRQELALIQESQDAVAPFAVSVPDTSTSEANQIELLKLRAHVAELLRQNAALEGERDLVMQELQKVANALSQPQPIRDPAEEEALEQEKQTGLARLNFAKQAMLALVLSAHDNDGWIPESLAEVENSLTTDDTPARIQSADWELLYSGRLADIENHARTVIIRERQSRPRAIGEGFTRAYGFADGHSEIVSRPDGDFTAWEAERLPPQ